MLHSNWLSIVLVALFGIGVVAQEPQGTNIDGGATIQEAQTTSIPEVAATQESSDADVSPTRVVGSWLATVDVDGQEIQVFEMPGKPDNVLYTAPYRFKLNEKNEVDIVEWKTDDKYNLFFGKSTDEKPDKQVRLSITLVRNPQGTRSKIAQALRLHGIMPNITEANVNPADVSYLRVEDVTDGVIDKFKFVTHEVKYPTDREIQLTLFFSNTAESDNFKAFVLSGYSTFKITQRVVGERVNWEQNIDVRSSAKQALAQLIDSVSPVIPGDIAQGKSAFVTRKQREEIMEKVRKRVRIDRRVYGEVPENQLIGTLESVMSQAFIATEFTKDLFDRFKQADNLATLGINPSVITHWKDDEKTISHDEGSENLTIGLDVTMEAGGLFGLFEAGGEVDTDFSTAETWKRIEERHRVQERDGNFVIPTGFEIYRVSDGLFSGDSDWSVSTTGTSKTVIETISQLSTAQPSGWSIKEVYVEQMELSQLLSMRRFLVEKEKLITNDESPDAILPPERTLLQHATGDENVSATLGQLTRGKMNLLWKPETTVTKPKTEGEDPTATTTIPSPVMSKGHLVTVVLANESGDSIIHYLLFAGLKTGEIQPVGIPYSPVQYLLLNKMLYVQLRGPEFFNLEDEESVPSSVPAQ